MSEIVNTEEFNTNNAWGFGGGIGKVDTYSNGYTHRHGRAYFRHLPAETFHRYRDANGIEISRAEFDAGVGA